MPAISDRAASQSPDPARRTVALPDDLISWIEEIGRGKLVSAERKQGGARKEAWFVDLKAPGGLITPLFLRYDRSDPTRTKDPWTLHREASVYLALQDSAVPVPHVLGVHPSHQAMLSERLVGENWFSRITDPKERESTASDFMTKLAALHAIDVRTLNLPEFPEISTRAEGALAELDEWDRILDERGLSPDPALAFSLRWLRRNIPADKSKVVLVQGDTGPGNFMFREGSVVAVVDWELAHLGDPMDDIAWLSLRSTQEPFGDFPTRMREYESLSGNRVDPERVAYYRVMAETKLRVMGSGKDAAGVDGDESAGGDRGNGFIYGVLHRRLWIEALAAATHLTLSSAEDPHPRAPREHDWVYETILNELRHTIVPRITDPFAAARAKGIARLVKYLRQLDLCGSYYEERELEDLRMALGHPVISITEGRAQAADAVESGALSDDDYLRLLWRRIVRETELARPAMGVLADRHWPELSSQS